MKLIGFTTWEDKNYQRIADSVESDIAHDLTVQYMRQYGYRFTGTYHQNGECGTPYFDTGHKLCLSLRGWGELMAQVLNLDDNRGSSYCDWAWWAEPDEMILLSE